MGLPGPGQKGVTDFLVVSNKNGRKLSYLGIGPVQDYGVLQIFNSDGNNVAFFGTGKTTESGYATLSTREGKDRIRFDAYPTFIHFLDKDGNIALGLSSNNNGDASIEMNGNAQITINGTNIKDVAESFTYSGSDEPSKGSVVTISSLGDGVRLSSKAYETSVVGVISGAGDLSAGLTLGANNIDAPIQVSVALAGQVYVRASLENGEILPGDLMVSSSTPGTAMRADPNKVFPGSIIGKAIRRFDKRNLAGQPLVLMFVMNR